MTTGDTAEPHAGASQAEPIAGAQSDDEGAGGDSVVLEEPWVVLGVEVGEGTEGRYMYFGKPSRKGGGRWDWTARVSDIRTFPKKEAIRLANKASHRYRDMHAVPMPAEAAHALRVGNLGHWTARPRARGSGSVRLPESLRASKKRAHQEEDGSWR